MNESAAETVREKERTAPAEAAGATPLIALEGISKAFGGVQALTSVDFDVAAGEVHALVGENGAGKSTLIKILSGVHEPDEGGLSIDGEAVRIRDPRHAQSLGIATIYQENSLYPDLSVLENLFMGVQPRTRIGTLDWGRMRREAGEVMDRLAIDLAMKARAGDLSRAQTKLVEIARALLRDARVIIMDEPTAALPSDDVDRLFGIIDGLRRSGVAVLYISHRLEEIFRIAQRVTVLRDGERVASAAVAEVDHDWLIAQMVGRELSRLYTRHRRAPGETRLEVERLTAEGVFSDISFELRAGEILGMAGLVGSGRSEVARAILGIDPYDAGSVRVDGKPLPRRPKDVIEAGVALLPEDRTRQGLVLPFTVNENVTLAMLRQLHPQGVVAEPRELEVTNRFIKALGIRAPGPRTTTSNLSGGNQQKVVLGKWLATTPRVLILDEPTQGVDVGAKTEIHQLVDGLVQEGVAVLLISSELEEILGMADRVLVMHRGRIAAELGHDTTAEAIMRLATGLGS